MQLTKQKFTDFELQARILGSLYVQDRWSEIYTNYTKLRKRVGAAIKNNGQNTDRQIRRLVKERLVLLRKNGDAISLNPFKKK